MNNHSGDAANELDVKSLFWFQTSITINWLRTSGDSAVRNTA
jgi:hypothetical protein